MSSSGHKVQRLDDAAELQALAASVSGTLVPLAQASNRAAINALQVSRPGSNPGPTPSASPRSLHSPQHSLLASSPAAADRMRQAREGLSAKPGGERAAPGGDAAHA